MYVPSQPITFWVVEQSTAILRPPAFTDENGSACSASAAVWTLSDEQGNVINSRLNVPIAGSGSAIGSSDSFDTVVMVYEKNPDVVQLMVAQPFVQLAPQLVGLAIEIPAYSRIGGAMAVRPLGIRTMAGL